MLKHTYTYTMNVCVCLCRCSCVCVSVCVCMCVCARACVFIRNTVKNKYAVADVLCRAQRWTVTMRQSANKQLSVVMMRVQPVTMLRTLCVRLPAFFSDTYGRL